MYIYTFIYIYIYIYISDALTLFKVRYKEIVKLEV